MKISKREIIRKSVVIVIIVGMMMNLTACATKVRSTDLMENIKANAATVKPIDESFIVSSANFSIDLFRKSIKDNKNSLISPTSVLLALAMTANGANGTTREEMEHLLAGQTSIDDLNEFLFSYLQQLPSEKDCKLNIANSIWFRDDEHRISVKEDFLQKNATFYQAAVYKSPFDDTTLKDINLWVKDHTDGMIDTILDKIDYDTVMYLINAVVFDAKWKEVYQKSDIHNGTFTACDGTKRNVEMMASDESSYIKDDMATGFMKNYKNDNYSFVALLPNEGITVNEYIESLTGEHFLSLIANVDTTNVMTQLPKFSYDYTICMNDALQELGIPTAFDSGLADFSKLGTSSDGNIYIGNVLHKSFISVDELGTKAGAVTVVDMKTESAVLTEYSVILDRPFVYAIIDNTTKLPIFLGTVMDIKE